MIEGRNLNTDPRQIRLSARAVFKTRRFLQRLTGLFAVLVATLVLAGCDPADPERPDEQSGNDGTAAQQESSQSHTSSMGDKDAESKTSRPENFERCPSTRPEMCTQQYDPACGYFYEGEGDEGETFRTFGNHCTACQSSAVKGFVPGECPD